MNRAIRKTLVCSLLLSVDLPGRTQDIIDALPGEEPQVTVRMYDYAQESARTLRRAQEVAAGVLRQAGVTTEWLNCRVSDLDPRESAPGCREPVGSTDLILRLLPERMRKQAGTKRSIFGFAKPPRIAFVFFDRVEDLAKFGTGQPHVILGHMLAHEIGHLLLGRNSHSRKGIMQIPWDKEELKLAAQGRFTFTPREAQKMCSQVRERMRVRFRNERSRLVRVRGRGSS